MSNYFELICKGISALIKWTNYTSISLSFQSDFIKIPIRNVLAVELKVGLGTHIHYSIG